VFPFIANTDRQWFDYLSMRAEDGRVDEVNFWQPRSVRPMKKMSPGEPVFFRLKKPDHCVVGFGFFAHFQVVSIENAWDLFSWRNGDDSYLSFLQRLSRYRGDDLSVPANRRKPMGCTILREAVFWPESRWIRWYQDEGWAPNIIQGKTETDAVRAARLMKQLELDTAAAPAEFAPRFELVEGDERLWVESRTVQREGQGTFRLRLLDAYGRCAISGERTEPVLDAAHIQPYKGPRSNHIQNGLLLTKEFHALFDEGLITVTPDYEVRVSEAIAHRWKNGKRYYSFDGSKLRQTPQLPDLQPSRDALAWHGEFRFEV